MNTLVINDSNLFNRDIKKFGYKARAVLVKDRKLLVSHYGGVILLPGGSIDKNESPNQAIVRELREELGIKYDTEELEKLLILKYYQSNYHTREGISINRLITTFYYLGNYKGINLDNVRRTEKEKKDNFQLELLSVDELMQLLNTPSDNPRKEYFDRELVEVIKTLKL